MAKNHIWRIGLDASGFSRGARQAAQEAQTMSQQIRRSMDLSSLRGRVSDILGTDRMSAQVKNVTDATIAHARQQLEDLQAYKKQLKSMGVNDEDPTYGRVSEAISELTYDIQNYMTSLQSAESAEASHRASIRATNEEMAAMGASMGQAGQVIATVFRAIGKVAKTIGSAVVKIGKSIGQALVGAFRNLRQHLSSAASGFRQMVGAGLAVKLIGSLMGRLRSIVSEYVGQNAALQAQVNGLKNALGQALAPAINIVVNAMSALMPIVVGVSNAISSLIGMLGGKWASAAGGATKYAKAAGGAAASQQKMNRQLLSFDELNKLSSDSSSSGGGGGGGGSSTPAVDIVPKTPAWVERMKTSFSDLFSSEEFSAANIGGKLGMSIQTGMDWLGSEAMNFDWSGTGQKLRQNWDSFWNSGAIESFGRSIGVLLGGIGDMIIGFMGPSFDEMKQAFQNAGTKGILEYIGGMTLAGAGKLVSGFFTRLISPMFGGIAEYFRNHGHQGLAGFFQGLADKTAEIGKNIKEKFVDPLIKSVKNLLGIHSPSTVFAGFATNCVDGFTNKFSELKTKITEKLDGFKNTITETATKIKNAFNFEWKMPSLKLPHLSVTWEPVSGILAKVLGSASVPHFSVQWFAQGGILDGAQIFGRAGNTLLGGGEAGREAVLPLDRNTGWMDELAQRLYVLITNTAGSGEQVIRVPVTLDGHVLTEVVARNLRNRQRATGSGY